MNGYESEEIRKYKITDDEGIDLFLDGQNEIVETKPDEKVKDETGLISRKKIIFLFVTVLVFLSAAAGIFFHIQNIREEKIAFNKVVSDFNSMITIAKAGNTSGYDLPVITSMLDSTVKHFQKYLTLYPGDSRIENMYAELVVNKYLYVFISQIETMSEEIVNVDDNEGELEQAIKFNPGFLNVLRCIENVYLFLEYNNLFPAQPDMAAYPPQSWYIDSLSVRGKQIANLLKNYEITLREKFPVIYKYVKFAYNDVYPTIFIWQNFWNKYYQYNNTYNISEKSGLLRELQTQFPMLGVIKDNYSKKIYPIKKITIGLSRSSVIPTGYTTYEKEWDPITKFLKNKLGLDVSMKIINTEEELKNEFVEGRIDFAVFNNVVSGKLFSSNIGDPILIRVWNTGILDDVIMITADKKIKDISELKGKEVSFSKNAFSAPYLYFYKKNIEPELYFSKVHFAESSYKAIENVAKGNSDVAFVSYENFYYYQHSNPNVNLYQNVDITRQPLSILWARENLPSDLSQDFMTILSSIDPKIIYSDIYPLLHPYGSWIHFGEKLTEKYVESSCLQSVVDVNSIYLMSLKSKGDINKDNLKEALSKSLSDKGFSIVDVNNLHLPASFIENLDKYTLYVSAEENDDNIDYFLEFKWELKDTSSLLFSKKFSQKAELFPPNLSLILKDIGSYLPVYVRVTTIKDRLVKIRKPEKIELTSGKIVKFYKIIDKDKNGYRGLFEEFSIEAYGEGKIISVKNEEVLIEVNEQTKKRITTDDYAEINF